MKTDEEKPEYITEAMELLRGEPTIEIEAPRKVTERRGGYLVESDRPAFVKIYTDFKKELKNIDGDALKVWLFLALSINRYTKDARPGLRVIAEEVNLSVNTVRSAIERLDTEYHLLDVEKEDGKGNIYHPSDYVSVSKETVSNSDTVPPTVSNLEGTVSKNEGTVSTQYRKSAQLEELEEPEKTVSLSEEEISEVNKKVDKILELNLGQAFHWKGREFFRDNHFGYADWYHGQTNQICSKKFQRSWQKAFSDWQDNALEIKHLQEAYDQDIVWRKVFTDPNELTKKAIALKAVMDNQPKTPERKPGEGFYA